MKDKRRRNWDDVSFAAEVQAVIQSLGHFPSNRDLRDMRRLDLANQISRRGGFVECSKQFGVARLASDSDTGWMGEDAAEAMLVDLGFVVERRDGVKCPFDLLVNGVLRVDVKSARLCRYQHCCGWFYHIGKYPQSDVILLWQFDTADYYALPWFVCPRTNVTISQSGGKYASFRNNANLLHGMVDVRQRERQVIESNCFGRAA